MLNKSHDTVVSEDGVADYAIDPRAPAISQALDRHGAIYRKIGEVSAKRAETETAVETILADGSTETKNVAAPGDYIVTGPSGENYVIKADVFEARYQPKPRTDGIYLPCGHVVAISNPLRRAISILAPWGEIQHGQADCMIADIYDPATRRRAGEPYLIARAEFEKTYRLVRRPWYIS